MRLLVDSHVFLWFVGGEPRLSSVAKAAIESTAAEVHLSHASLWKLTIKQTAGRLTLLDPLPSIADRAGLRLLPITLAHIQATARLPPLHHDPFDRMLVAQAVEDGLTLVTADQEVQRYPVAWLW